MSKDKNSVRHQKAPLKAGIKEKALKVVNLGKDGLSTLSYMKKLSHQSSMNSVFKLNWNLKKRSTSHTVSHTLTATWWMSYQFCKRKSQQKMLKMFILANWEKVWLVSKFRSLRLEILKMSIIHRIRKWFLLQEELIQENPTVLLFSVP